jgi:proteic killer suppression protein
MERLAEKQWAMTVNGRWRICFEFRNGDAFDVEIVDYHKGTWLQQYIRDGF